MHKPTAYVMDTKQIVDSTTGDVVLNNCAVINTVCATFYQHLKTLLFRLGLIKFLRVWLTVTRYAGAPFY